MRRLLLAAPVLVGCLGCLSPVTDRLDHINEQLAGTNQRLDDVSRHGHRDRPEREPHHE